jgi:hypothetical protein
MTAELTGNFNYLKPKHMVSGAPKDALPGARWRRVSSEVEWGSNRRRTPPMDPQERPGRLPLFQETASEEPISRSLVLRATQDDVICGWIGR